MNRLIKAGALDEAVTLMENVGLIEDAKALRSEVEKKTGRDDVDLEQLKAAKSVEEKMRERALSSLQGDPVTEVPIMWGDVTEVHELVEAIDTKNRRDEFEKEVSEGRKSLCLNCGKPIPLTKGKKKKKFCDEACRKAYGRRKNNG